MKGRLHHNEKYDEVEKHIDLYSRMHQLILDSWRDISDEAIEAAWQIPGLEEDSETEIEDESEIETEDSEESS